MDFVALMSSHDLVDYLRRQDLWVRFHYRFFSCCFCGRSSTSISYLSNVSALLKYSTLCLLLRRTQYTYVVIRIQSIEKPNSWWSNFLQYLSLSYTVYISTWHYETMIVYHILHIERKIDTSKTWIWPTLHVEMHAHDFLLLWTTLQYITINRSNWFVVFFGYFLFGTFACESLSHNSASIPPVGIEWIISILSMDGIRTVYSMRGEILSEKIFNICYKSLAVLPTVGNPPYKLTMLTNDEHVAMSTDFLLLGRSKLRHLP